ncbi:ECF transporter S component [[Clostridium] polysaccharolyticum]|uniref:Uncharacterized membrane protein n=1 Tax=[Clostridium] polysaccharolyticum TaxID=29364 RepID=A0A1I0D3I7_9FIRM|nr:ECF transporter S component [[Clostridium] polysaccharolyticum]SET26161.1 Uncharacterized membrane protein [[Clostridium] polysaccharolyticum]
MKEKNMVTSRSTRIYKMTITALFSAFVYIATRFINITLPISGAGGLVHLGNVPVYIAAILFGSRIGAVSGSFGMALFDLTSGWTIWAPFTFITLWIEGYAVGAITKHKKGKMQIFFAMCAALIVKCAGYYIAEVILFHNFFTPLFSISANVTQVVTAGVVTIVLVPVLNQLQEQFH